MFSGIGNPPGTMDMKAYLLQKFSFEERKQVNHFTFLCSLFSTFNEQSSHLNITGIHLSFGRSPLHHVLRAVPSCCLDSDRCSELLLLICVELPAYITLSCRSSILISGYQFDYMVMNDDHFSIMLTGNWYVGQIDAAQEQGIGAVRNLVLNGFNHSTTRFNLGQKYKYHKV